MQIDKFINAHARERISRAVAEAEVKTAGEIVPMVVTRSDQYSGARWRLAILVILLGSLGVYFGARDWFSRFPLMVIFGLVLIGDLLGNIRPLRRLTLTEKETAKEVFERALLEFHRHKLSRTQGRTGIMIFVSLFERRVVLLADDAINTKVESGTWDQVIAEFVSAIKDNHLVDGFVTAIAHCGVILTGHLPAGAENRNELTNELIVQGD